MSFCSAGMLQLLILLEARTGVLPGGEQSGGGQGGWEGALLPGEPGWESRLQMAQNGAGVASITWALSLYEFRSGPPIKITGHMPL